MSGRSNGDVIDEFIAVTHASREVAQSFVSISNGDLEVALSTYFEGLETGTETARVGDSNASTSGGQDDAAPHRSNSGARPRRQRFRHLNAIFKFAGAVFATALRTADWIISLILPVQGHRALRGFLARIFGRSSFTGTRRVSIVLSDTYGNGILRLRDGKWQHSFQMASQRDRQLLIYLHSDDRPGTAAFCSEVLCDPEVVAYASRHFVCWGAMSDSEEGRAITELVNSGSRPTLLVVGPAPQSDSAHSSHHTPHESMRAQVYAIISSQEGRLTPEIVLSALRNAVLMKQEARDRLLQQQRDAAQAARSLREQQDAELAKSMAEDRRRAEAAEAASREQENNRIAQEQAAQASREEAERRMRAAEDRKVAIEERRAAKSASMPPEPTASCSDMPTTLIRVRMPDGGKMQRRFLESDVLNSVYDWVDSLSDLGVWDYVLTSTFPRRDLSKEEFGASSLLEAGLVPNAAVMVTSQDED